MAKTSRVGSAPPKGKRPPSKRKKVATVLRRRGPALLAVPPTAQLLKQDIKFMRLAIDEAKKCQGEDHRAHPLVGAVVVKDGRVVGTGYRGEVDSGEHAEFTALEKKLSRKSLSGATVYTTLEPCTTRNHPKLACAQRLIERRVSRVVIGMLDPNPKICGRGVWLLREAGVVTDFFPHIYMAEIEEINREFVRQYRHLTSELSLVPSSAPVEPTGDVQSSLISASQKENVEGSLSDAILGDIRFGRFAEARAKLLKIGSSEQNEQQIVLLNIYLLEEEYLNSPQDSILRELEAYTRSNSMAGFAFGALGNIALKIRDYDKAIERFERALDTSPHDSRALWVTELAGVHVLKGDTSKARDILILFLNDKNMSNDDRAAVFTKLASIIGDEKLYSLKAVLLSKASQLSPNSSRRFESAFALSQADGLREISAIQYQDHLKIDEGDSAARNNLAAQLGSLGIRGGSHANYKQAAEAGQSLAAANLANIYIAAGLYVEAKEILARASKVDDPHRNVAASRTALFQAEENESRKLASIVDIAVKQQIFIADAANAVLERFDEKWLSVEWKTQQGASVRLKKESGLVTAEWLEEGDKEMHMLDMRMVGSAAEVFVFRRPTGSSGIAYLHTEKREMHFMLTANETVSFSIWKAEESSNQKLLDS